MAKMVFGPFLGPTVAASGFPAMANGGDCRIQHTSSAIQNQNGKRLSEVFDDHKTAAYEQKRRESEVEEIKQGRRAPAPLNKTFDDICNYWIENRLPQKRNAKDDLSIIRTHLLPAFGKLKLKEITVQTSDHFVAERLHLTKKTVSNHLTLLISLLRLAVDLNWLIKLPNIKKLVGGDSQRGPNGRLGIGHEGRGRFQNRTVEVIT